MIHAIDLRGNPETEPPRTQVKNHHKQSCRKFRANVHHVSNLSYYWFGGSRLGNEFTRKSPCLRNDSDWPSWLNNNIRHGFVQLTILFFHSNLFVRRGVNGTKTQTLLFHLI